MAQKILIKKSTVAAKAPTDAQLDVGELAVNTADALLYTKHSDGSIKRLSPTMDERTKIANSVSSSDARLTNSREWSEATVTQAEAEGGIASTRRAWTSRRVRQAINAWWQLVTSGFGRNLVSASNEAAARNILQLGTAATSSLVQATGASTTDVMSQKAVTDAIAAGGGGGGGDSSLQASVKVTVGASGDFQSINAAVLHLSRFIPDLGVTAEVELLSGFVMSEQLFVEGLDLGWITITGVDAETIINEPSLMRTLQGYFRPAFCIINGALPTIGQLFRFSSKGSPDDARCGVMAFNLGRSSILPGCGVIDAGNMGIAAYSSSTISAYGAIASGAGLNGVEAYSNSAVDVSGADVSGAGVYGIYAEGSRVSAGAVNVNGAGTTGIHASQGSIVTATIADAIGAGDYGIYAEDGSTVSATGADASGAGISSFYVYRGSTITADGAKGTLSQTRNTATSNGIIFQESEGV